MAEIFAQVAPLLTSAYKSMFHVQHREPYSRSNVDAIVTMENYCNSLIPNFTGNGTIDIGYEAIGRGGSGASDADWKGSFHKLLLDSFVSGSTVDPFPSTGMNAMNYLKNSGDMR